MIAVILIFFWYHITFQDVYIKIRVELISMYGNTTTFVMSFHFAEKAFTANMFPYKK